MWEIKDKNIYEYLVHNAGGLVEKEKFSEASFSLCYETGQSEKRTHVWIFSVTFMLYSRARGMNPYFLLLLFHSTWMQKWQLCNTTRAARSDQTITLGNVKREIVKGWFWTQQKAKPDGPTTKKNVGVLRRINQLSWKEQVPFWRTRSVPVSRTTFSSLACRESWRTCFQKSCGSARKPAILTDLLFMLLIQVVSELSVNNRQQEGHDSNCHSLHFFVTQLSTASGPEWR